MINFLKRRQISYMFCPILTWTLLQLPRSIMGRYWQHKQNVERMNFRVDEKNEKKRKWSEMYSFHNFQLNIYLFHAWFILAAFGLCVYFYKFTFFVFFFFYICWLWKTIFTVINSVYTVYTLCIHCSRIKKY